jgi:hypothetical protein
MEGGWKWQNSELCRGRISGGRICSGTSDTVHGRNDSLMKVDGSVSNLASVNFFFLV